MTSDAAEQPAEAARSDTAAQRKPAAARYDPPGWADQLDDRLLRHWNATIDTTFQSQGKLDLFLGLEGSTATLATPFFRLGAAADGPEVLVKWSADPLAPANCIGLERARELCDDPLLGRRNTHQEYCEYRIVWAMDGDRCRPKRVQVTTELREYWLCIAEHSPRTVRDMAAEVLGRVPAWEELYGTNPRNLDARERRREFARLVAGNGEEEDLEDLPDWPEGTLNTKSLLFMAFGLNGLDNLLQILLLAAHRYADDRDDPRPADAQATFLAIGDSSFACRRADPALMAEGQDAAFNGDVLTLANPPGVSILGFTSEVFTYRGGSLPEHWIRWSRGHDGYRQRLEVGPPDDEPAFLDDILDATLQQPLTGGFQVLRQLEVGVRLLRRTPVAATDEPFQFPGSKQDPTSCSAPERCAEILELLDQLRAAAGELRRCPD